MPEPTAGAAVVEPPTIVNTPPPVPPPAPAAVLFPTTPTGEPPVKPPEAAPVTPPVVPTEPPKTPAEPAKPGETPKSEPPAKAPTDYDLKLPDGSQLTKDDLSAFLKEAKEKGLTKEQAEEGLKLRDGVATLAASRVKTQQEEALKNEQATWKPAIEQDPEMGGKNYAETVALASRAFKAVASPLLQKLVDETGFGSHPEFVRMMRKVGQMMAEDKLILGSVGGVQGPRDPAAVLYGKTTPDGSGRKPG